MIKDGQVRLDSTPCCVCGKTDPQNQIIFKHGASDVYCPEHRGGPVDVSDVNLKQAYVKAADDHGASK